MFESMNPYEQGWFLGQVDQALAEDYDENYYEALCGVSENWGDANILYLDDRLRRAVVKFADDYVDSAIKEAERLGVEVVPDNLARVVGAMCCLAGIAVGMLDFELEDEEDEER